MFYSTLNSIFHYLIQANILLIVLYLFYKLCLSNDTFFACRRFALLGIVLVAFVLPLIPFSAIVTSAVEPIDAFVATITLPETLTEATVDSRHFLSWVLCSYIVYIIIAAFFALRTIISLMHINYMLIRSRKEIVEGIDVRWLRGAMPPFSFFRWICLPDTVYEKGELHEILLHEKEHVTQYHSIDILIMQWLIMVCWINPVAWLLRKEVRINHEYQADQAVINGGADKKGYQYHLLNNHYPQMAAANLYNNFNVLPLKKRIMMLNQPRTHKNGIRKYLLFIPVIALLCMMINCTSADKNDAIETIDATATTPAEMLIDNSQKDESSQMVKDKVYDQVTEMPEFPGGISELMAFLSKNIKYPEMAQKAHTQGRVIAQFIVNTDGSVSDVTIVKSIDPELDAEAKRVIESMPAWQPGKLNDKVVRVKYTIPVMFKLN